jgi:tetratricopeptide (TPR) repeat protein
LENLALRKALQKDPESGLYNRRYFLRQLKKILRDRHHSPLEPNQGLTREVQEPSTLLVAIVSLGRGQAVFNRRAAKVLSTRSVQCLARLDQDKLGLLLWADPEAGRLFLDNFRQNILQNLPDFPPTIGYALWPQDLAFNPPGTEALDLLMERAKTALFFASGAQSPSPIIGFGEMVEKYGHLTQILPQDRVVVNLGRAMGARAGQVFAVKSRDGRPKGEISLFETSENYALANVTSGGPNQLSSGDLLTFSRFDAPPEGGLTSQNPNLDQGQKRHFLETLTRLANAGGDLTTALIAIDDWEKMETLAGPEELAKRLTRLQTAAEQAHPCEMATPWDSGTLAVVWALSASDLPAVTEKLRAKLDFPVSLGLAPWPCPVIKPDGLLTAARQALLEASMTGSAQTIMFGPQCLNIAGDHLFEAGDLVGAMEEYRRGLILEPGRLNLLNSLGVCQAKLGDHRTAILTFDQVLAKDPDNLMALFNKGCSLILEGRLEEAANTLALAVALPSPGFEPLYQYGRLSLELGQIERALPILRQAASLKERRGVVYRQLGQAELLTGNSHLAMEAFKKAVKHDPDDARSLSSLGVLFLENANDRDVAVSLFQRSVEIEPTNSLFRQRLGKLLFDRGDFSGAERHLRAAVEYGCLAPDIHRRLEKVKTQDENALETLESDQISNKRA